MLRYRTILMLLLAAAALPAAARPRVALGPDGRAGRREMLRGRWERAAAAFQRAVDSGHPTPAELEGLGYCSMQARRYATAASAYQRLCGLSPDSVQLWILQGLADVYQQPARLADAEAAFRHALQLSPKDPDALINLAVVLHKQGHAAEALPLAQQAVDVDSRKAYVLAELGEVQTDLGQYTDAYRSFQRALARDHPAWPPTRLGLAGLFYARGLYADAMRSSRDFLHRTEGDPERWADERVRAESLLEQAQRRLGAEAGEDKQPPQISFLVPRLSVPLLSGGQLGSYMLAPGEDQDQFGILGVVQDDRGVKQVTANGANAVFLQVKPDAVAEIKDRLSKNLILDKGSGGPDAGETGAFYLFHVRLRLRPEEETPIHIAASDFAGHVTAFDLTVRRPPGAARPRTSRAEAARNTWALFVGVDRYLNLRGASTLQYAADDIQRLYDLICDPADGGVDPSHAFLLHDDRDADEEKPTRANIARCFEELRQRVQPSDTVLFFFSGHGAVYHGATYLLTRDAQPDHLEETALSGAALDRMLQSLPARRVIVFLDACHAAGIESGAEGPKALEGVSYGQTLTDLGDHCRLFASCGADQLSYEDPLGLQAGVFSHYLAEGLSGKAAAGGERVVRLDALVAYVERHVQEWCGANLERDDPPEHPVRLPSGWHEDLPLAFVAPASG